MTTIQMVNNTGVLRAVKDGPTHVSVKPVQTSRMTEWINSRLTAIFNPHAFSKILQSISIKIK
ncbi:MAG TPA: hypothetical protein DEP72_05080 [Clostridiales bacterium]|nr:MAG: hypothetical protein A2Y18_02230 [Clostridiales bacterium GWD2_32_19]HCC07514.1 hypothetical protein [Clostridiales bacterium]